MNTEDGEITSKLGKSVAMALEYRQQMSLSIDAAIDDNFNMGCEVGIAEERQRILELLENKRAEYLGADLWADAAGMDDAIALIKEETNEQ